VIHVGRPADVGVSLQDEDAAPRGNEMGGSGEAADSAADDNDIPLFSHDEMPTTGIRGEQAAVIFPLPMRNGIAESPMQQSPASRMSPLPVSLRTALPADFETYRRASPLCLDTPFRRSCRKP